MNSRNKNQIPIIKSFNDNNIKVFALGGLGEVGRNMYCVECENELIIIDSGIMFPDTGFGIDYVIPDYTYLIDNEYKIKALFITHGHEDHIGGIPHLLSKVKIPVVYAAGIAVDLIKGKMSEYANLSINLQEYTANTIIDYNNFSISFFNTNHSVPDSYGIAIKTRLGYIIHTGDFKFDFSPLNAPTDFSKLTKYADEGVLCLLSDSTNANVKKFSLSEKKIGESIKNIFSTIKGRILISTFASNVYRVGQIIEASIACDRKVIVYGRSMEKTVRVALKNGYINAPNDSIITNKDLQNIDDDKLTIITTGSQGEPLAALSRISQGIHKQIKIKSGDTIIFSSSAIPGNQQSINKIINRLYHAGADVIVNSPFTDTHTSGHASETELQIMLNLVKPKYFMPIHGEFSMQNRHIELAIETGVPKENCFLMDNGDVLTFTDEKVFQLYAVQTSDVFIDEDYIDVDGALIKERKLLSEDGIVIVTYTVRNNHRLLKTSIDSCGFISNKNAEKIIKSIQIKAKNLFMTYFKDEEIKSSQSLNSYVVMEISNFIQLKTDRRPIVIMLMMHY